MCPTSRPSRRFTFIQLYSIPLRCYHSRNVSNLFFAGRNISATHVAFASTRVMATCALGGQAIGTAAALWRNASTADITALSTPANVSALQQALLRDDAYLLNLPGNDSADLARTAKITASSASADASPELVADGITRDLRADFAPWSSNSLHHWESTALPATLSLALAAPAALREIHLTFDSGFQRELVLTPSDHITKKIVRGPQPETVKHYRIKIDGSVVVEETANYHRKRIHRLSAPVTGARVEIEVVATHGVPTARVFEVRLYS
jgi:FAD dependent oxidoreductase